MTLADLFRISRSVKFLEGYETPEKKRKALNRLISEGLSFYCTALGSAFLICLSVILLKTL